MDEPLGKILREQDGPLLLTGHTGFKGTWMTFLLQYLNVPIIGYSLPAETGSLFDRARCLGAIPEKFADIREYDELESFMDQYKPSTVIHMAAQPLVLRSYEIPHETFNVNVMGTANILDIAFRKEYVQAVVIVTSDKVYRNNDSGHAYLESDPLEGKDPYSASKVATEAVVSAWQQISRSSAGPAVISVRAGNVIGGGDFSSDRIIPDLIRAVIIKQEIKIRNPRSTRPWQHVLDPIVGYLMAIEKVLSGTSLDSLNFGPLPMDVSVEDVVNAGTEVFPDLRKLVRQDFNSNSNLEAKRLQIDSRLSESVLNWLPKWDSKTAIELSFSWWNEFLVNHVDPHDLCLENIKMYFSK
jgi:CDP-glucose 4,6-dehydratase